MILPGGGLRLQTLGGLATQLFDSTLRTRTDVESVILWMLKLVQVRYIVVDNLEQQRMLINNIRRLPVGNLSRR